MSLSACNGIFENIYDAPIETEMEIKENSFSQVKTVEYTEWAYINLSERTVTTVKIGEEYESQIPDKWDFAIHRYDIKTNEGAAYKTTYTSIDEFKATGKLPKVEDFVEDEWTTDKIAIDMSGMMDGNIIYTCLLYTSSSISKSSSNVRPFFSVTFRLTVLYPTELTSSTKLPSRCV